MTYITQAETRSMARDSNGYTDAMHSGLDYDFLAQQNTVCTADILKGAGGQSVFCTKSLPQMARQSCRGIRGNQGDLQALDSS